MGLNEKSQLIKISKNKINGAEINSVNAREIYDYLEIKTRFDTWIKRAIEKYDFKEGVDFCSFLSESTGGRKATEFIVTIDMAKELAMLENNSKGKEVRKYFIKVEKQANKPLSIDQLLDYNKKVIEDLRSSNLVLTKKIEKDSPKVLFANSVSQSESSILVGQFAKAISTNDFKIGQNRLFSWLRDNKYLIANGSRFNQPMQKYIDNGYFEVIERTINNPDGSTRITVTTKITGKGQVALAQKVKQCLNER